MQSPVNWSKLDPGSLHQDSLAHSWGKGQIVRSSLRSRPMGWPRDKWNAMHEFYQWARVFLSLQTASFQSRIPFWCALRIQLHSLFSSAKEDEKIENAKWCTNHLQKTYVSECLAQLTKNRLPHYHLLSKGITKGWSPLKLRHVWVH